MRKTAHLYKNQGYTFIELGLVLAIFGIIAGLATPYLLGTREKLLLEKERDKIAISLKTGQQQAIAAYQGYDYRIRFQPPQTYVLQPERENQTVRLNPRINIQSISPANEVVFAKLTGKPENNLELVLTSKRFRCQVNISSEGVITTSNPERK